MNPKFVQQTPVQSLTHMSACSIPFPIHAPSILVGSLSLAMWMFSGICSCCEFSFLIDISLSLCSGVPIGITSVFVILNLLLILCIMFLVCFVDLGSCHFPLGILWYHLQIVIF